MNTFKAYRTQETEQGFSSSIEEIAMTELPANEVIVKVHYTGINYKDYLSSQGNKGVTRNYPHTPGIDASGVVVEDKTNTFAPGTEVVVMGYDLGMNTDGAFAEYICVPAAWVLEKPARFTMKETMQIGTSGFTAALGISKMLKQGQKPSDGPILVSGATGGVGVYAVQILHALGFEVVASTNKTESITLLEKLGASRVVSREEIAVPKEKPLVRPQFAGGVDTVGGETLVSMLKLTQKSGSVCTCGNVGGHLMEMTVFPFILNGINLLGINGADTPMEARKEVWQLLSKYAQPALISEISQEISLDEVNDALNQMGQSKHTGRYLIKI